MATAETKGTNGGVIGYHHVADVEAPWQPTYYKIGTFEFAAKGDYLIAVEDEFRSGYECRECNGTGKAACGECKGAGTYAKGGDNRVFKCTTCEGTGKVVCKECNGKGALLVIPDQSVRRPTTGHIVSAGPGRYNERGLFVPMVHKVGEDVLYSNFAGHELRFADPSGRQVPSPDGNGMIAAKIILRILHDNEILATVRGHLEMRRVANPKSDYGV